MTVAGVRVILRCERAHQGLALLVPGSALAASTLQAGGAVPTAGTVRGCFVGWAGSISTGADLLRITLAGTRSTYAAGAGELAILAAFLIRVIANSAVLEFACGGVAAGVVTAIFCSPAIAFFAILDDTVPALVTGYGCDSGVVRQAGALDAITAESRADVSDSARTE